MPLKKFTIKGMHCKSCKLLVEDIMDDIEVKVSSLEVDEDKQTGTLTISSDIESQKVIDTIEDESDYKVEEIK
ncbi:cation transporter [Nanoarchaeota archaeon]